MKARPAAAILRIAALVVLAAVPLSAGAAPVEDTGRWLGDPTAKRCYSCHVQYGGRKILRIQRQKGLTPEQVSAELVRIHKQKKGFEMTGAETERLLAELKTMTE
jgi:hypothetical protein